MDNGVRRNVYPVKCPHCGVNLTKGTGVLKYSVTGCQKLPLPMGGKKVPEKKNSGKK